MNQINISIANNQTSFRPYEWIEGLARWQLDRDVNDVEIRLIWFTRGKGDTDISVLDIQRIERPSRSDSRTFRFDLPDAPYSFSGKYISLIWAIEVVAEGVKEAARHEFILAPDGKEIELGSTDKHLSTQEAALQRKAESWAKDLASRQKAQQ